MALEDFVGILHWNDLGINFNGEFILQFADDMSITTAAMEDLISIIDSLSRTSEHPLVFARTSI